MNTNKFIRFFTIFILFVFVSIGNIAGCNNSSNMPESEIDPEPTAIPTPEPTLMPTPEPTPIPTLEPTPIPTPVPTRIPQPVFVPPQAPSQKNAATAIALTCASLIAEASDDDPGGQLIASYRDAVNQITALKLPAGSSDIPAALGIIRTAIMEVARDHTEFLDNAKELAAICEEDIDAL